MTDHDPDADRGRAMTDDTPEVGRASGTEGNAYGDRWIPRPSILEAELPDDLQVLLGRLLGRAPVETFGDWVAEVRRRTGGGSLSVDDLCHSAVETPHWGELAGERSYFRCSFDAVILAALTDRPVAIRTRSPTGAVIEARAAGTTELSVTPDDAVFSFGIDARVQGPDEGDPTPGDIYAAVCPYVRAFAGRNEYDVWAERVPAATVVLPPAGAVELAAALAK